MAVISPTQNSTNTNMTTLVGYAEKLIDGETTTQLHPHTIWNMQHVPFFILFASIASIVAVVALLAAKKLCGIKDDDPEELETKSENKPDLLPSKEDLEKNSHNIDCETKDLQNELHSNQCEAMNGSKEPLKVDQEIQYEYPAELAPQPLFAKPREEISRVTQTNATSNYLQNVLEGLKITLVKTTSTSGIVEQSVQSTSTTSLHQQEEDDYESLSISQSDRAYNKPVLMNRQQVTDHLNSILLSISSDTARIDTNKFRRKQSIATGTDPREVRDDQQQTENDISEIQDSATCLQPQLDPQPKHTPFEIHGFKKYDSWPFDPPVEVKEELNKITNEQVAECSTVDAASQTKLKRKKRRRNSLKTNADIATISEQDAIDERSSLAEYSGEVHFDDMFEMVDLEGDIAESPPERPHDFYNGGGIPSYNLHRQGDKRYGSRNSIYRLKTSSKNNKPRLDN